MIENHTQSRFGALTAQLLMAAWLGTGTVLVAGEPGTGTDTNALHTYNPGRLEPLDSKLKVKVGDMAPLFSLRAVRGGEISLRQFRGKKNVVLSFVPAAFTPVCSAQWPGYNLVLDMFEQRDAVLLGITTDNIPSLYAWDQEMGGMRFDILSDFYPHGAVAASYGVLRHDGMAERALFVIDKRGVIRYIDVHDINERPPLEDLIHALDKLQN
ncbi:MAG TPA: peroxiredoxin [Verrucomicrobiae bacterium]|nr:peroxiredoxin [Verrucomicrobiae bacterium]